MEGTIGETGTFGVMMEYEDVTVTWHKGSENLENSDKYKIVKEGHWHRLEIRDLDQFDEGEYYARIAQSNRYTKLLLTKTYK